MLDCKGQPARDETVSRKTSINGDKLFGSSYAVHVLQTGWGNSSARRQGVAAGGSARQYLQQLQGDFARHCPRAPPLLVRQLY